VKSVCCLPCLQSCRVDESRHVVEYRERCRSVLKFEPVCQRTNRFASKAGKLNDIVSVVLKDATRYSGNIQGATGTPSRVPPCQKVFNFFGLLCSPSNVQSSRLRRPFACRIFPTGRKTKDESALVC